VRNLESASFVPSQEVLTVGALVCHGLHAVNTAGDAAEAPEPHNTEDSSHYPSHCTWFTFNGGGHMVLTMRTGHGDWTVAKLRSLDILDYNLLNWHASLRWQPLVHGLTVICRRWGAHFLLWVPLLWISLRLWGNKPTWWPRRLFIGGRHFRHCLLVLCLIHGRSTTLLHICYFKLKSSKLMLFLIDKSANVVFSCCRLEDKLVLVNYVTLVRVT